MKRDRHAHLGRTSAHRSFFLNQIGACHILLHTTSNQSHETTFLAVQGAKEGRMVPNQNRRNAVRAFL